MKDRAKSGPKPRKATNSSKNVIVRVTEDEKDYWKDLAEQAGAKNVSAWIRQLVEQAQAQAA